MKNSGYAFIAALLIALLAIIIKSFPDSDNVDAQPSSTPVIVSVDYCTPSVKPTPFVSANPVPTETLLTEEQKESQRILDSVLSDLRAQGYDVTGRLNFSKSSSISLTVSLSQTIEKAKFGNYAYDLSLFCEENISIDYVLYIELSTIDNQFFRFADVSGKSFSLTVRSVDGKSKSYSYDSIDGLADYFPALNEHIGRDVLSSWERQLYDEIWAALDAEPLRDENEILQEIADAHGMTFDEIKSFLWSAMEKVYS